MLFLFSSLMKSCQSKIVCLLLRVPTVKEKMTMFHSEATLVFSSFCEGRAQQITASGVIAMEKLRVPKLCKKYEGAIP